MWKFYEKSGSNQIAKTVSIVVIVFFSILLLSFLNPFLYKSVFTSTSKCNLGLFFSAVVLASIAIMDDFSNFLKLVFWKSLLIKLILILYACDLAYVASQTKDDLNDKAIITQKAKADSLQLALTNSINDSTKIYNKRFNDSLKIKTRQLTDDFITALANNGKDYDIQQKKVIDLVRDSARKQEIKVAPPELFIDTILVQSLPLNTHRLTIRLQNKGDEAKNIKFIIYGLAYCNHSYYKLTDKYYSVRQIISSKASLSTMDVTTYANMECLNYYLYIKGEYLDKFGKSFNFDNLIGIDVYTSKISYPNGYFDVTIMNEIKKYYPDL